MWGKLMRPRVSRVTVYRLGPSHRLRKGMTRHIHICDISSFSHPSEKLIYSSVGPKHTSCPNTFMMWPSPRTAACVTPGNESSIPSALQGIVKVLIEWNLMFSNAAIFAALSAWRLPFVGHTGSKGNCEQRNWTVSTLGRAERKRAKVSRLARFEKETLTVLWCQNR
jgi:hypothetical protein